MNSMEPRGFEPMICFLLVRNRPPKERAAVAHRQSLPFFDNPAPVGAAAAHRKSLAVAGSRNDALHEAGIPQAVAQAFYRARLGGDARSLL
jgi:hypothetical protein